MKDLIYYETLPSCVWQVVYLLLHNEVTFSHCNTYMYGSKCNVFSLVLDRRAVNHY